MDRFDKHINLDPNIVKELSLSQKQECMAEINKRREQAWKFSVFFCLGVMAFIMVYYLISTVYTLRFQGLLPNVSIILFIVPVFIFVPSFFAHFMNGKCVMWAFFAYAVSGFAAIITSTFINAWIAPFAFAGAVLYVRLSHCCDMYSALAKEEGFPDFFEMGSGAAEAKAIIERNSHPEEEPLNILTQAAIIAAQNNKNEDNVSESVKQGSSATDPEN